MEKQARAPLWPLVAFGIILLFHVTFPTGAAGQTGTMSVLPSLPPQGSGGTTLPDSLVSGVIVDPGGSLIQIIRVPGTPPSSLKVATATTATTASASATAVILEEMPAYIWSFGCSPTSAAMMAGYYDLHGYPDMYTGPANGGVAPLNNLGWGTASINGETRYLCPLSATRNGLDGRTTRGHVDDYWIKYGNSQTDPYLANNWAAHTPHDCAADFMGTNQSALSNRDGSTTFYYYVDNSPYSGKNSGDGGYGLQLFLESRGYKVVRRFSQYISGYNNLSRGFTFEQYKAEIDAGRPVMIHVEGHSMAGYGYDPTGNLVYVRDTWDLSEHTFPWGGSYAGSAHYAVSVLELEPPPVTSPSPDLTPAITVTPNVMNGEVSFEVIVRVTELGAGAATDPLTLVIPRDTRWSLDGPYASATKSLAGVDLNNDQWSYDASDPAYHVFRNNLGLGEGAMSTFGFKALFNSGNAKGVYTITTQILPGNNGETMTSNNSDSEKIDYFSH